MTINPLEIQVDWIAGPPAAYGFRKGNWTVHYAGKTYEIFTSVPAACTIDQRIERVRNSAARQIAREMEAR